MRPVWLGELKESQMMRNLAFQPGLTFTKIYCWYAAGDDP
jgi:hypothetical protein